MRGPVGPSGRPGAGGLDGLAARSQPRTLVAGTTPHRKRPPGPTGPLAIHAPPASPTEATT
jgi:hypothetical protein